MRSIITLNTQTPIYSPDSVWLIVSLEALSPRAFPASLVFSLPPDLPGRLKVRLCSFSLLPSPRLASLWVRLLVLLA